MNKESILLIVHSRFCFAWTWALFSQVCRQVPHARDSSQNSAQQMRSLDQMTGDGFSQRQNLLCFLIVHITFWHL